MRDAQAPIPIAHVPGVQLSGEGSPQSQPAVGASGSTPAHSTLYLVDRLDDEDAPVQLPSTWLGLDASSNDSIERPLPSAGQTCGVDSHPGPTGGAYGGALAAITLEYDLSTTLDFGGIQTTEAERAIMRASKGGGCGPVQLKAAVSLANGAEKLKRQIVGCCAVDNDTRGKDSSGTLAWQLLPTPAPGPSLLERVAPSHKLRNQGMDSVKSSTVGHQELACKALGDRSRERGAASVYPDSSRLCSRGVGGDKMVNGIVLGSSPGGGMMYIEPQAAVPFNNELIGARAIAMEAEEEVLFELSGKLMGIVDDVLYSFKEDTLTLVSVSSPVPQQANNSDSKSGVQALVESHGQKGSGDSGIICRNRKM
eukprot:gene11589-34292_t